MHLVNMQYPRAERLLSKALVRNVKRCQKCTYEGIHSACGLLGQRMASFGRAAVIPKWHVKE